MKEVEDVVRRIGKWLLHSAFFLAQGQQTIKGLASGAGNGSDETAVVLGKTDPFFRLKSGDILLTHGWFPDRRPLPAGKGKLSVMHCLDFGHDAGDALVILFYLAH